MEKQYTQQQNLTFLLIRYLSLVCLMFILPIIYLILKPLTVYVSSFLLSLFYTVYTVKDYIIINNVPIQIVSSCVAGSAYLLLLILNLSLPLSTKKRFFSLLLSIFVLFVINVLRIVLFSMLYTNNFKYFILTHNFTWYFLSTLFVVLIWILTTKLFKIKSIPIYSDLKSLLRLAKK
ncbi:pacearchaeosortase [Candidatus Pacearchaeota archaeon]|nr:pacearchaeosortase [Candidatus Pacearchaeota archaeon]